MVSTKTKPKSVRKAARVAPPLRLEWIDPAELADNPANWRVHSRQQLSSLDALLSEVGWAGALLYNERTKRLLDGHARKGLRPGELAPVLIGSWDEATEKKILATLDPVAAMAEADASKLNALLHDVQTSDESIAAMLHDLAKDAGCEWACPNFQPVGIDEQGRLDEKSKIKCPECGHEF